MGLHAMGLHAMGLHAMGLHATFTPTAARWARELCGHRDEDLHHCAAGRACGARRAMPRTDPRHKQVPWIMSVKTLRQAHKFSC